MKPTLEDVAKLKPCPFCGGENIATVVSDERRYMTCDDCIAEGPLANNDAEAVAAWNRRATPTPDVAALVERFGAIIIDSFDRYAVCKGNHIIDTHNDSDIVAGPFDELVEAEIKRDNMNADYAAQCVVRDGLPALIAAQEGEVARLRGCLRELEAAGRIGAGMSVDDGEAFAMIEERARAALAGGK